MKKTIIIRSVRVALVLAILCASMYLTCFRHYSFVILILVSLFFLDASDSMLVWRLKRIEDPRMRASFIYAYLIATLTGVVSVVYALISTVGPEMGEYSITLSAIDTSALRSIAGIMMENPFKLYWLIYSVLIVIFSFRYYVIVVRVMARYLDVDDEC